MSNPNVHPIAQDFVIAAQVSDANQYFFHDPNLTQLDDGTLLIAAPHWPRQSGSDKRRSLRIFRSDDAGQTWDELPTMPFEEGTPFVLDGQLLMFVQQESHKDFQIVSSDNRGFTWTEPRTVIEGPIWNISTAMVTRPDALYWAMSNDSPKEYYHGKVMVRLDRNMSPLDPKAWSMSNVVTRPEIPSELTRNLTNELNKVIGPLLVSDGSMSPLDPKALDKSRRGAYWLEPNTVEVSGRIRVFTRCSIDRYSTANIAAVLDYDTETNHFSFTQFTSWPGAQCKFFVINDQPHRMYWMLSNLATNSQDLLGWGSRMKETGYRNGPGNERRWLFLHYSIDCLNWFPAGCVARWPNSVLRSFMYPSAVVDGEDMVVLSRTSQNAANQHDADLCTIHRIQNFRDLAMDLHKGGLRD